MGRKKTATSLVTGMFKLQISGGQTKPISLSPFFRWSVLYTLYKESDMTQDIDLDVANCLKNKNANANSFTKNATIHRSSTIHPLPHHR
jgi:hypothetical protein